MVGDSYLSGTAPLEHPTQVPEKTTLCYRSLLHLQRDHAHRRRATHHWPFRVLVCLPGAGWDQVRLSQDPWPLSGKDGHPRVGLEPWYANLPRVQAHNFMLYAMRRALISFHLSFLTFSSTTYTPPCCPPSFVVSIALLPYYDRGDRC